jgi:hypothetical protein
VKLLGQVQPEHDRHEGVGEEPDGVGCEEQPPIGGELRAEQLHSVSLTEAPLIRTAVRPGTIGARPG